MSEFIIQHARLPFHAECSRHACALGRLALLLRDFQMHRWSLRGSVPRSVYNCQCQRWPPQSSCDCSDCVHWTHISHQSSSLHSSTSGWCYCCTPDTGKPGTFSVHREVIMKPTYRCRDNASCQHLKEESLAPGSVF